jgi:hypothetical protein
MKKAQTFHFSLKPDFSLKVAQKIDPRIKSTDYLYQVLSGRIKGYSGFKQIYFKKLSDVNYLIEKTLLK